MFSHLRTFAHAVLFSLKYHTYAKFWPTDTNTLILAELSHLWEGPLWTRPKLSQTSFQYDSTAPLLFCQQIDSLVITSFLDTLLMRLGKGYFMFNLIHSTRLSGYHNIHFHTLRLCFKNVLFLWIVSIIRYETTILGNLFFFFFLHWKVVLILKSLETIALIQRSHKSGPRA